MLKPQNRLFHLIIIALTGLMLISLSLTTGLQVFAQASLPMPRSSASVQVDAGVYHSCGLRTDGSVACWGFSSYGDNAPVATFTSVSAGWTHSCGLKTDGSVVCWGENNAVKTNIPDATFSSISAGYYHMCGIKTDGTLACWGSNGYGQNNAPSDMFISVSAGSYHTCGLKPDSSIVCWGRNDYGQSTPPSGTFSSISAGYLHTCGVKTDGTLACWGHNGSGQSNAPTGTFSSVSAGYIHTCGLKIDGSVVCWQNNGSSRTEAPSGTFSSISAGNLHNCGVKTDGTLFCWGDQDAQLFPKPNVTLNSTNALLVETGTTSFTVDLSILSFQNVTVNFAISGTAESGTDYTLSSGTSTTIGIDSTSSTIEIVGIADNLQEDDETIIIDIDSVVNGEEVDTQQITVTIPANAAPTPTATNTPTSTPTNTPTNTDVPTLTYTPSETPVITNTATSLPPTNSPTLTETPSATTESSSELIQNGGFEAADLVSWSVKNETGDKVKCKAEKAHSGNCAFVFKGGEGESATLQQTIAPSGMTFALGDTLDLSLFINAKSGSAGKVKIAVSYSDGTAPDKFSQDFPATGDYSEVSRRIALNSANVDKIKLQLKHQSESGKVYIDDVSLIHKTGGARLSTLGLP